MTKYQKVSLTLPDSTCVELLDANDSPDRDKLKAFIVALRQEGWTLESIAAPLRVSREWIRQLEADSGDIDDMVNLATSWGFNAPERPIIPERVRVARPEPLAENIARMLELQPLAQAVRSNSSRYREEAEEYTRLVAEEHSERGVSLYRLAKELGVTHGALRFRLVRYGYRTTTSASKVYQPIIDANRVIE